ncbi:MAG: LysR family transcriptional regulator [Alphaproteobacteria bacterium]|nr:LysR family transcriptional regulator [Alphaproteobacteria bacterium]
MTSTSEKLASDLEGTPRFRNFDWEKAKNFYYVAKCGSFAGAARFLNISQPALSRQVIYLEQTLGCPLFSRHSGGIKLTRKGEELFSIVEATFVGLKGFTQNSHAQMVNGKKRKIRIATTHALAAYVFSDLILDYNKAHPELCFELIGEDHLIDIVLNDVDIAIRPLDPRRQENERARGFLYSHLFTAEKKLYASCEYLKEHGCPQTIEDLKEHSVVAFGHPESHPYGDVNWILTLGMPEGELHEPVYTSNSVESLIDAAKKGIGIVGSYEIYSILKSAQLKNILPNIKDLPLKEYFIYPDYLKNDKTIKEIKEYLREKISS